jgi:hypothetical protein
MPGANTLQEPGSNSPDNSSSVPVEVEGASTKSPTTGLSAPESLNSEGAANSGTRGNPEQRINPPETLSPNPEHGKQPS